MQNETPKSEPVHPGERIAKVMARAGLCSRREAERWVEAGRVRVNGETLRDPATNVTEQDEVVVDGSPLAAPERTRLWRYHKPAGLITSNRDPQGRTTVFEKLPASLPRVMSIGRLDITSEGLLLLTNDGELARRLELPATGWLRRYRVRAFGDISDEQIASAAAGVTVDGATYGAIELSRERRQGDNVWLIASLREGKNREVRKVMEHFGLKVNRLIRVSYGPFQLGDVPRGEVAEVPARVLRDQLGTGKASADAKPRKSHGKPPRKRSGRKQNAHRRRRA